MWITIWLESRDPPVGRLEDHAHQTRAFTGWLELLALLEAWVVAAPPTRVEPAGSPPAIGATPAPPTEQG